MTIFAVYNNTKFKAMEILLILGFCWLMSKLFGGDNKDNKKDAKKKRKRRKKDDWWNKPPTYAEWYEWEKNK